MPTTVTQMLASHPGGLRGIDEQKLAACIQACLECAQACTACADACLAEEAVAELRHCIRTDLDCAEICATSGTVLSRVPAHDSPVVRSMLEACAVACGACADECEQHVGMHDHCRVCAEVCRRCEQACRDLLESLG